MDSKTKGKSPLSLKIEKAFQNNKTYVYYAKIPKKYTFENLYPPQRQKDVQSTANLKVKEQKYFVWKLLQISLLHLFESDFKQIQFYKKTSGKWGAKGFYFSLSHSKNVVAVAISESPVGVDLQAVVNLKSGIESKILTKKERVQFSALSEEEKRVYLAEKWAQKESVFKMKNRIIFSPSKIETSAYNFVNDSFEVGDTQFVICACAKNLKGAKITQKTI